MLRKNSKNLNLISPKNNSIGFKTVSNNFIERDANGLEMADQASDFRRVASYGNGFNDYDESNDRPCYPNGGSMFSFNWTRRDKSLNKPK